MVWLGLAAGCTADDPTTDEPAPAPARTIAGGPTTLPAVAPSAAMTVRLLEPGAEPRRELRYRPAVGSEAQLDLDFAIDMAMSAGGRKMFGQKYKSHGKVALRVTNVEQGAIAIDLKVLEMQEPNFDPSKPTRTSLAGLTGSFKVGDRGQLLWASPSLESSETKVVMYLLDYLNVLPVEPVGLGARWELDGTILRNSITMRIVQTHRLVALDAAGARTEISEKYEGARQRVTGFSDEPLTMFEVSSLEGGGSGTARVAFDKPLAVATVNNFDFTTAMGLARPSGAQSVAMTMHGETTTTLE